MPKTIYIIPVWKNSELSRKAISTALDQPDCAVIAIDNNSMDGGGVIEMFEDWREKKIENLILIENKENLGWVGGINQGIEIAKEKYPDAEFYCFLNNDVELPTDFWDKIEPHFAEEDTGAVGPIGNNVSGLHDYNVKGYPNHHEVKFLIGFCFVVRRKLIDQIGGLDPIFGWGLSDDLDISLRIRKFGYRLFIARDCRVFHHGSKGVELRFNNDEIINKVLPNLLYLSILFAFVITIMPRSSYLMIIASYLNLSIWGGLCFYYSFDLSQLRNIEGYNALEIVSEPKNP